MARRRLRLPAFSAPTPVRSENMRRIRSTGNSTTERRLVALLSSTSLRGWESHPTDVPHSPDVLFRSRRLAIFVDGCFWHSCPRCGHMPRSNVAYWRAKLTRNRLRDLRARRHLNRLGYSVIRLWECRLRDEPQNCMSRISRAYAGLSVRRWRQPSR